jgi:hypothetical protein
MNRARMVTVLVMLIVLAVTLAGAFLTRGVMAYLPFLQARNGSWAGAYVPPGVVDQRPWQTAATLAALAQSAEERELAREAKRLADHEVDQAFSQSLRQASLERPSRTIRLGSYHSVQAPARDQRVRFPMAATWRLRRRNLASTKTS